MRKPQEESRVRGNVTVPLGPSRPDRYYSQASRFEAPCKSILQANAQARIVEQDITMGNGGIPAWNPELWQVRHEYRKKIVDAGSSTWCAPKKGDRC